MSDSFIFLQNLIHTPPSGIPEALYFGGEDYGLTEEGLEISSGGFADFNSYFNSFSFSRWHEYTGLETICLKLVMTGTGIVDVTCRGGGPEVTYHFPIAPGGETVIELQPEPLQSRITVRIFADTEVVLSSGIWGTCGAPHRQDVVTAAVLCATGRDDELFRTLEILHSRKPPEMGVVVIDNASRLGKNALGAYGAGFQLFHNPDTGESGGFTRGLIEAARSYQGYTHALLLSEGIRFDPEMLYRTQALLSCLKPEFRTHFLSGAELSAEDPSRLLGDGFSWNGYRRITRHPGLDLTDQNNLALLEEEGDLKNPYAPWGFCVLPLGDGILSDLPFPFYSCGDAMDFSFRRAGGILSLPGLGAWIEAPRAERSPLFKSYYRCRNTLILNALHPRRFGLLASWRIAARCFWKPFWRRDFLSARLALMGLDDFLEGAEYVTALDDHYFIQNTTIRENKMSMAQNSIDKKRQSFMNKGIPNFWLSLLIQAIISILRLLIFSGQIGRNYRKLKFDRKFWNDRFRTQEFLQNGEKNLRGSYTHE